MSIFEQVSEQLKVAMRSQDKERLTGLRGIRAAFIEALKVDGAASLSDDAAMEILRRLAKQRRESIEAYAAGGRQDLVAVEETELKVIEAFLPQVADEATTRAWVQEAITRTGATGAREMGKVMAALMQDHKAVLDGKLASRLVRELLGG